MIHMHDGADKQSGSRAELLALLSELARTHEARDADALAELYAEDAVIFDMAPPLGRHGIGRDTIAAWFASWDGPVAVDAAETELTVEGDLAFVSSLNRMRGRQQGQEQDLWFRTTMCLRRTSGRWLICHDHSSVPFYMDGSDRAALDLSP